MSGGDDGAWRRVVAASFEPAAAAARAAASSLVGARFSRPDCGMMSLLGPRSLRDASLIRTSVGTEAAAAEAGALARSGAHPCLTGTRIGGLRIEPRGSAEGDVAGCDGQRGTAAGGAAARGVGGSAGAHLPAGPATAAGAGSERDIAAATAAAATAALALETAAARASRPLCGTAAGGGGGAARPTGAADAGGSAAGLAAGSAVGLRVGLAVGLASKPASWCTAIGDWNLTERAARAGGDALLTALITTGRRTVDSEASEARGSRCDGRFTLATWGRLPATPCA